MAAVGDDETMEPGIDPIVFFIKASMDQMSRRIDEQGERLQALERKLDVASERIALLAETFARSSHPSDNRPPLIPGPPTARVLQTPPASNPSQPSLTPGYPVGAAHAAFVGGGRNAVSQPTNSPYAVLHYPQMGVPQLPTGRLTKAAARSEAAQGSHVAGTD